MMIKEGNGTGPEWDRTIHCLKSCGANVTQPRKAHRSILFFGSFQPFEIGQVLGSPDGALVADEEPGLPVGPQGVAGLVPRRASG